MRDGMLTGMFLTVVLLAFFLGQVNRKTTTLTARLDAIEARVYQNEINIRDMVGGVPDSLTCIDFPSKEPTQVDSILIPTHPKSITVSPSIIADGDTVWVVKIERAE